MARGCDCLLVLLTAIGVMAWPPPLTHSFSSLCPSPWEIPREIIDFSLQNTSSGLEIVEFEGVFALWHKKEEKRSNIKK